jgi:hypothetical protein
MDTGGTTEINWRGYRTIKHTDQVPNLTSFISYTISYMFATIRSFETTATFGWGTSGVGIDTHMTKNVERGAVSYLAQSTYGKNAEIWKNPSSTPTTGCAGASASAVAYAGCEYTYNTANGMQASTTGNIYGVYDMSGGVWEFVPAYIDNGNSRLTSNGNSIISADSKYKDVYKVGSVDTSANNYALTISHKGDALYETSSNVDAGYGWYNDYTFMPTTTSPWFGRGGFYNDTSSAGIYAFFRYSGTSSSVLGARATIAINNGL